MKPVISRLPTSYEAFGATCEYRSKRFVAWMVVVTGTILLIFACIMRSV